MSSRKHSHLPAVPEARQMILLAALATNLDAIAGCDIFKSRLRHAHISAEADLEGHTFGHLDKIELFKLAVGDQQRAILLIDLEHSPCNCQVLANVLALRCRKRKCPEQ